MKLTYVLWWYDCFTTMWTHTVIQICKKYIRIPAYEMWLRSWFHYIFLSLVYELSHFLYTSKKHYKVEIMSSIEDWSQPNCVTLAHDLGFQYQASYGHVSHTHSHTQTQVQSSVGSKDRMETNGRTDGRTYTTDCFSFPANVVGKEWYGPQLYHLPYTKFLFWNKWRNRPTQVQSPGKLPLKLR